MPSKDELSEDALTELLKKDARESSIKYSALGLEAFLPKRPTTTAPKPNTRFLRNIIRETDSHNAALKAKEVSGAAARKEEVSSRQGNERDNGARGRLGKRKRDEDPAGENNHKRKKNEGRLSPNGEIDDRLRSPDSRLQVRSGNERRRGHQRSREEEGSRRNRHSDRHRDRSRSRSRSPRRSHKHRIEEGRKGRANRLSHELERHMRRDRHRSQTPSLSPPRHRHGEKQPHRAFEHRGGLDIEKALVNARRDRHRGGEATRSPQSQSPSPRAARRRSAKDRRKSARSSRSPSPISPRPRPADRPSKSSRRSPSPTKSDPLDDILGPVPPTRSPPVRPRGRGAVASASGIDAHFAASYDPTTDVRAADLSDDDEWESALEALRDRQRWRQQGAARLRTAGFSEEEVKKWEKGGGGVTGGGEGREEDVRWKTKGEGREWDRGKVVGTDGSVLLDSEGFGRLKGA